MRTGSAVSTLQEYSQITKKGSKFLLDLVEFMLYKIEVEKSIEWTPENIKNFFLFMKGQQNSRLNIKDSTIKNIIALAKDTLSDFSILELSSFVHSIGCLYPSIHQQYWEVLANILEKHENFEYFELNGLLDILKGIFLTPDTNITNNIKGRLDVALVKIAEEIIRKIRHLNLSQCNIKEFVEALAACDDKIKNPILYSFTEKIHMAIDNFAEFKDAKNFELILKTLDTLKKLGCFKLICKELFIELNNKIFLGHISMKDTIFADAGENMKSRYLKLYLQLAEDFGVFQVALLDSLVMLLYQEMNSKYLRSQPSLLSECISSLAYLNYPGRFTVRIPHKQIQYMAWQGVLEKTEDLAQAFSYSFESDETDCLSNILSPTSRNLNFLWALCVFNLYSKASISSLIQPICLSSDENFSHKNMVKLFQIHYWLSIENYGEFALDSKLIEKMMDYKAKWDAQNHKNFEDSELKETVRRTLTDEGVKFRENYHDFPYVFDFVHVQDRGLMKFLSGKYGDIKHTGIVVEDDSSFLEGTQQQIRDGFKKVMSRQLAGLGWNIRKFSVKNWIHINSSEILSK